MLRLHEHKLPARIIWAAIILTAAGVAVTNFVLVWSTWFMTKLKNEMLQAVYNDYGLAASCAAVAAVAAVFAASASVLVAFVAPICAGSGLPEMRSCLNGSKVKGLWDFRAFSVRLVGMILAIAAGFPIGREGPSIVTGCNIGFGAVQLLAVPHVRRWINIDLHPDASCLPALMVDEERLAFAKRVGSAVGGAAGMATIFNAPIGGLLYMFEEVTVAGWAPELTLKAFICTVVACLGNRAMLNLCGESVYAFIIFADGPRQTLWSWQDMPVIIVVAALLGAASALYTRTLSSMWSWRRRWSTRPDSWHSRRPRTAKIVEATVYAVVCALVFCLIALCAPCHDDAEFGSREEAVRFQCKEGEFNTAATLIFNGPEEAIKLLYSRFNSMKLHPAELLMVLFTYVALNIGMMGLAVPMGCFIPFMFCGALSGRVVGHFIGELSLPFAMAPPGVYALVGSAALLAGTLHQTLSIVVFLMECINDLDVISPLMVAVFVSHVVSKQISRHGLDEQLLERKNISYLDSEPPEALDSARCTALDLCNHLPRSAKLQKSATVSAVRAALDDTRLSSFPVVSSDGACVGLITRKRLQSALYARTGIAPEMGPRCSHGIMKPSASGPLSDEDADVRINDYISELCMRRGTSSAGSISDPDQAKLPVSRLMDSAPYVLLENTPAPRLYPLFARLGISVACVVGNSGELCGVLSRDDLIQASRHEGSVKKKRTSSDIEDTFNDEEDPEDNEPAPDRLASTEIDFEDVPLRRLSGRGEHPWLPAAGPTELAGGRGVAEPYTGPYTLAEAPTFDLDPPAALGTVAELEARVRRLEAELRVAREAGAPLGSLTQSVSSSVRRPASADSAASGASTSSTSCPSSAEHASLRGL